MKRIVIVGGGAAGFFGAIACGNALHASGSRCEIVILEKGRECLTKVRISGGGRCNVTHACFESRPLASRYPRGERALIGAFQRFQATDTIEWFSSKGVRLKTESDGRMFPTTDASQTIIDCLMRESRAAGVRVETGRGVKSISKRLGDVENSGANGNGFVLTLADGETLECDRLLLATGGCKSEGPGELAAMLGHTIEPPVPSLFTFHIETPWLRELSGLSIEPVEISVPGTKLRERGPFLATHWGASGPVVLRLSAWGARVLHGMNHRFPLHVNWLPETTREVIAAELQARRNSQPAGSIVKTPIRPIPARLWEALVLASGVDPAVRWAALPRAGLQALVRQLVQTEFAVTGRDQQSGVRHVRRRPIERSRFQNDGKSYRARALFCW